MSAVYTITAYPKVVALRDGSEVTIRPLNRDDEQHLADFFHGIPEEDRFFLKDEVLSPSIISQWVENLNYDRALPLVTTSGGSIIGEAVLVRRRGNARSHVAEIRVTVTPSWRNKGLGSTLIRELCDVANDAELDKVLFEVVDDCESNAAEAARAMGFVTAGTIEGGARDIDGHLHNISILAMPLGKYYEWSKY
jgi:L-amino acid N-acyltransferase YncA